MYHFLEKLVFPVAFQKEVFFSQELLKHPALREIKLQKQENRKFNFY